MRDGLVRVLAADPKLMELAYGRVIFDTYGQYAATPAAIIDMLEAAVADMQARAARFAGVQRDHTPTTEDPFTVVLVDEVAFLTAYQPDRKMRERVMNALATLTTQGRAVGYAVVAALQDPRKDVLTIRNLFPDRIAMRLDEPEQVDMVLGDGARDRGAACELISTDPATGAGVAYIRLEADPDPVRVRAGWVTDTDIRAMTYQITEICNARDAGWQDERLLLEPISALAVASRLPLFVSHARWPAAVRCGLGRAGGRWTRAGLLNCRCTAGGSLRPRTTPPPSPGTRGRSAGWTSPPRKTGCANRSCLPAPACRSPSTRHRTVANYLALRQLARICRSSRWCRAGGWRTTGPLELDPRPGSIWPRCPGRARVGVPTPVHR